MRALICLVEREKKTPMKFQFQLSSFQSFQGMAKTTAPTPRWFAATKIQASFRGHQTRRELVENVRRDFEEVMRRLELPFLDQQSDDSNSHSNKNTHNHNTHSMEVGPKLPRRPVPSST